MATYVDESIDSYFYSSYNPYSGRYPKPKGAGWRNNYLANYVATEDYFDNHQRAQLKSILSQINPNLTPRLRKANTKDVAVQVNPKMDVSVQCSLGPRTLMTGKRDALRKRKQEAQAPGSPAGSPGSSVGGVLYPRTLAVYSPVASRRLAYFLEDDKGGPSEAQTGDPPETVKPGKKNKGEKSADDRTVKAKDEKTGPGKKTSKKTDRSVTTEDVKADQDGSEVKTRVRFQFLEQKYGYYHCRDCNLRWESAYVWCVQGTSKVYFKQFCRTCQKSFNPYRVEDITCQTCNKSRCVCEVTPRHIDPKRPHRQDLCGRCKGKRLSCDRTFSFKYII
ncbi:zygote arrest protein 1 [Oncorhynchus tshawytscha]|uniref:3CxxC-type domain-containing protein n=1 Tax=Oncorhynchus tshawytscha TaxID=74940 RepID=A0A8C8HGE5_ONCTS|nr:zygote arrest protein 1 [Oncorhynchus tshawytscha]